MLSNLTGYTLSLVSTLLANRGADPRASQETQGASTLGKGKEKEKGEKGDVRAECA